MTLDWSTKKIKHFNDNPDDLWVTYGKGTTEEYQDVNAETKALIFGTMAIGIGNLKYTNAPDFYARWKIMEKYDKIYLYSKFQYREDGTCEDDLEYTYLSPSVVMKHIGLSTNVGYVSKKDWISRYVKSRANDKYIDEKPNIKDLDKMYKGFVDEFENGFNASV